jgi:hypothetical protein
MSENNPFGFAKLVPGFDFLQNLAQGTSQTLPQMPGLSSWIAPTLNVEELEKRIAELKAVHYWLDQNGKALGATIQALEVQKMTLATLQGMNLKVGEMAEALKVKPAGKGAAGAASPVDPLQWWGALTQQFQEIATNAMKDAAPPAPAPAAAPAASRKAPARKSTARKKATKS